MTVFLLVSQYNEKEGTMTVIISDRRHDCSIKLTQAPPRTIKRWKNHPAVRYGHYDDMGVDQTINEAAATVAEMLTERYNCVTCLEFDADMLEEEDYVYEFTTEDYQRMENL